MTVEDFPAVLANVVRRPVASDRITYCRDCGKTKMVEWLHRNCAEPPTEEAPVTETLTAAERLRAALDTAGLAECPKCAGLFASLSMHRCYEDTFDALVAGLGTGKAGVDSRWALGAVLSSHTGYEYTVVLNRNTSGAHGTGRAAIGMSFASYRDALARAIEMAQRIDTDPTVTADDESTVAWLAEPEM